MNLAVEQIAHNLAAIRERIATAAKRAGRSPEEVEIVAATKYVPTDEVGSLAEAGVTVVGENRLQDLVAKQEAWRDHFTWDFIGHLQSRKVKDVAARVRMIHSVDSVSAVKQLAALTVPPPKLLLQVNIAGESTKSGVAIAEVADFLVAAEPHESVAFTGLMTMPPLAANPEQARPYFAQLRELAEQLKVQWQPRHSFTVLSMGTSQDFVIAVEEGATTVRIGSTLYGGFSSPRTNHRARSN